jgi:peptidoglycan hydrolase FlgJ
VAINPPSDIVLDVLNAADPLRSEAVTQRLSALGANAAAGTSDDFTRALDAAGSSSASSFAEVAGMADARTRLLKKDLAQSQKTAHAQVEFEASLLNNLVGEMLPKNAPGVYGEGTAGDVWRSMLGDQIAHQIAKSGELGIAKRLFSTHPLPHDGGKTHASLVGPNGAADTTLTSGNLLSAPTGADFANGAFLFTGRKSS